jgi:hypothetical protein
LYAGNRWLVETVYKSPFLHEHFDLRLIPAALPIVLGFSDGWACEPTIVPPTAPKFSATWRLVVRFEVLTPDLSFLCRGHSRCRAYALALAGLGGTGAVADSLKMRGARSNRAPTGLARHQTGWRCSCGQSRRCRNAFWNEIPSSKMRCLSVKDYRKISSRLCSREILMRG